MKKLNNKGNAFFTILLLIISISSIIYIGYDKFYKKSDSVDSNITNNNISNSTDNISVMTAVEYEYSPKAIFDKTVKDSLFKITLPKIVNGKGNAEILNSKMLEESSKSITNATICSVQSSDYCFKDGLTVNYEYINKNNILAIYIYSTTPNTSNNFSDSGDGTFKYIYFYNYKTDSIIYKYSEIAKIFNLKDIGTAKNYEELDTSCIDFSITNNNLIIKAQEQCV